MKIIADKHIPYIKDYFAMQGELILHPGRCISATDVADADLLLVRSVTQVNETLLKNSSVKFVGSVTAGVDHIDIAWLNQQNIAWSAAPGFNAPPVADYVLSVVAALQSQDLFLAKEKTAAVIGVGNVGRLVVERLKKLGFNVLCVDPLRAAQEPDFVSVTLEEVQNCDLISLHVPLTYAGSFPTHHFINKHFLQRQKTGCVLINASRGAVIHAEELKKYGLHCHWCFDVWENEPYIDPFILEHALIATPHIAGYSLQSKMRGMDMVYQQLIATNILNPIITTQPHFPSRENIQLDHDISWQEKVLQIFNPLAITKQMRDVFRLALDPVFAFDAMRLEVCRERGEVEFMTGITRSV